jgi:hypothetical protein
MMLMLMLMPFSYTDMRMAGEKQTLVSTALL